MPSQSRPVALVTGSATGIGRACAVRFAKLGYDVVVNYSQSDEDAEETVALVEDAGANSLLIRCDVSADAEVVEMIAEVERTFGRLDVLVNNAGTTHFVDHKDLEAMSEEKWDRILAVNLKGPFFCIRAAADLLRAGEGGAVVSVSSVAGISGLGSSIAYCASKGALNTMTKSLARVLAPKVRVNAVCPGPVDSRWLRGVMSKEELYDRTKEYPLPRPAQPDDITDAVIYLATGTSLTTGQLLVVDGGRTM
ncbi:MAG: SDR family oxidoreductase [Planctomycetaceae bacterium]|nr:SDR family oxidoreductase [Planctomycetaceae bacterium]